MGIRILPPDVNESDLNFTVVGRNVRYGLGAVKNVGHGAVEGILAARRRGGPFRSLQDFCERVDLRALNSRAIACLIKAGACDSLGGHRAQLLAALDTVIETASATQREREAGQSSLFDLAAAGPGQSPSFILHPSSLPDVPPWSSRETLQNEKEQVGFYISGHPLDEFEVDYRSFATSSIRRFRENENAGEARLLGEIHKVNRRLDRNGNLMAFFELEDFTGQIECIAFSKTHATFGALIEEDQIVYVRGTPNSRQGDVKCQTFEIIGAEDYRAAHARWLEIVLRDSLCRRDELEAVCAVLRRHGGTMPVRLVVPLDAQGHLLALEAGREIRVSPTPRLLAELRESPATKRLTFRGA
jgi:DNA polymerase-3 subunit alpha